MIERHRNEVRAEGAAAPDARAVHDHLAVGADLSGALLGAQPRKLAPDAARKPMGRGKVVGAGTAQRVTHADRLIIGEMPQFALVRHEIADAYRGFDLEVRG